MRVDWIRRYIHTLIRSFRSNSTPQIHPTHQQNQRQTQPLYYVERPLPHPTTTTDPTIPREEAPIIRLSNRIQGEILKAADPEVIICMQCMHVHACMHCVYWALHNTNGGMARRGTDI